MKHGLDGSGLRLGQPPGRARQGQLFTRQQCIERRACPSAASCARSTPTSPPRHRA